MGEWEDAAKNFKPSAQSAGTSASPASGSDDGWKVWQKEPQTSGSKDSPGFFQTVGNDLAKVPENLWNTVAHPFDSSELGKGVNFGDSITPQDRKKADADLVSRKNGFPLAGRTPIVSVPPAEAVPGFGETAGHIVSPYIADAALGAIGEGVESPAVRGFVGGAARAVPGALKKAMPYGVGASLMNHFMPGPIATAADVAAAVSAIPPVVRAGRAGMAGKSALGPMADSVLPLPSGPRGLLSAPADGSYVRGSNAQFGEQPLLGYGPDVRVTPPPADTSYVRGAQAMAHPPNPARALGSAPTPLMTPAPADASYVRGIDAQYPEVLSGPLTPPEAALPAAKPSAIAPSGNPDYSAITSQYKPSRTKARFDASGKRIGG